MPENKDKILMIAATPFFSDRGCHIRIYNEIKYLKKEGIYSVLCTYHLGNNIEGFDIKRIHNVSWYKKITPGFAWGKIYLDLLLLLLSYKEYKKNKPKIIHAHLYEGLLIAFFVKIFSFSKVKIVFDCQGSLAEEMYAYTLHKSIFLKPLYYFFVVIEKILLYIPNKIFCSSQNSYDFLITKYHISKERIDILNDGIDTDLFESTKYTNEEVRKELNIPLENMVILYTGSISEAKGVKELFDTIPQIIEQRPDITFVFAGYGDLEIEYRGILDSYIKSKNVVFTGRFSYFDLPKYTVIADYAIDPKKDSSESSGKLYNYIAAGLPVICFKNKINSGILGEQGVYVDNLFKISYLKIIENFNYKKSGVLSWSQTILLFIHSMKKNIKIGIDIRTISQVGGCATYARNIIPELSKGLDQHTLYLFLTNNKYRGGFNNSNIKEIVIPISKLFLVFYDWFILPIFCYFSGITTFFGPKSAISPFYKIFGIKTIVTIHDIIPITNKETEKFLNHIYWKLQIYVSYKFADYVITDSEFSRKELERYYGPRKNISVIYLGINKNTKNSHTSITDAASIFEKFNIKKPYVLYVGTIQPRKNVFNLIKAFELGNYSEKYNLVITGKNGWLSDHIMEYVKNNNLQHSVIFTGQVSEYDLASLYKKATCFTYISINEGFGFPIIEAMLHGVPVITSNISCLPEIGGDAALYADPYDTVDISEKIKILLEQSDARDKLIVNGYKNIGRFNWNMCGEKIVELIKKYDKN